MTTAPAAPGRTAQSTPPWWRSLLVAFLVVFPTVEFFNRVVGPRLPPLPWLVRDVAMVLAMYVVLSNALPLVNRRLERRLDLGDGRRAYRSGRAM